MMVGIIGDAGERGLDRALGNALRGRLLLEGLKPGVEVAAARGGRQCRRRGKQPRHSNAITASRSDDRSHAIVALPPRDESVIGSRI